MPLIPPEKPGFHTVVKKKKGKAKAKRANQKRRKGGKKR